MMEKSTALDEQEQSVVDVAIVGAGWAGLSAGRQLLAHNQSFVILEGRHEIGGRCRTITLQDGKSVAELGAQWIHDACDENPVSRITSDSGVSTQPCERRSGSLYIPKASKDGKQVHHVEVSDKEYLKRRKQLMEAFLQYQEKRKSKEKRDLSLHQCLQDFLANHRKGLLPLRKNNITEEDKAWLYYFLDSEVVQEYAASLEDLSLYYWDSDDIDDNDDHLDLHLAQELGGGYQAVLEHFAKPLDQSRTWLNCKVTSIDWSNKDCLSVKYQSTKSSENDATLEERQVVARKVLITVPLGVLKAKTIQFLPELPESKQMIIDKMGYGCLNKCLILWDEKEAGKLPWPLDKEWIERIVMPNDDANNQQGVWTEFYNPYPLNKRPMLCGFLAGKIAIQMEENSDDEIQRQALQVLRDWFAPRTIPDPIQVVVTRWGQDEFSRGSYSYNAVGAYHRYRDRLADPVNQQLYFAGEACHSRFPSTTQGAYLSGKQAAEQMLKNDVARKGN